MFYNKIKKSGFLFSSFVFLGLFGNEEEKAGSSESRTFNQVYQALKGVDITPYAGPSLRASADISMEISYILWNVHQAGLQYAYSGLRDPTLPVISNFKQQQGEFYLPNFKINSGFKLGMGVDFSYDRWDFDLIYTWLHANASSLVNANHGDGILLPAHAAAFEIVTPLSIESIARAISTGGVHEVQLDIAETSWKLQFNTFDLEFGRNFFISPKLLMNPRYGMKITRQKQINNIRYEATGDLRDVNTLETYKIYGKQHYWGIGPKAAMDLSWLLTRDFSIFSDAAVSILWGQFRTTRKDVSITRSVKQPIDIRSRIHNISAVVEMALGVRYDVFFPDEDYRFRAEASWESQRWFDQNHFLYISGYEEGDLSFQGFTLTFALDF